MKLEQIYQLIEIPNEVKKKLEMYGAARKIILEDKLKEMLLNRKQWDEGIKGLQKIIGDDPDGIKILWEMLNLACDSFAEYEKRKIPTNIFIDTMKFCTRFLEEHYRVYGQYKFVWAWWFPRQLALEEFRVGCLEYEFVKADVNVIFVHIPSDADLQQKKVLESLQNFFDFRKCFFPEWEETKVYCESWLLSPVLKDLLDDKSNILGFQKFFIVENTDYDSMGVMDWVFPGYHDISDQLPENTSLQRKMKKYLLQGKKVGWSRGYLNESYIDHM